MLKEQLAMCQADILQQPEFKNLQPLLKPQEITQKLKVNYGQHIDSYVPYWLDNQFKSLSNQQRNLAQKVVILHCANDNIEHIFGGAYSPGIEQQYQLTLKRFIETCYRDEGWSTAQADVYWKDLAMARCAMFPAGAQVVENSSGFGITQGFNQGLAKALSFTLLNLRQGGSKGYYQIHTHTPDLAEFNPQGWNECYLRIAQMLQRHNHIKGIFGGSWFYDPQLANISPRLMYLQDEPLQNGASSFLIGPDRSGNATFSSNTRRKLYNEGKYIPMSYLLIWPRKAMLYWAESYSRRYNIDLNTPIKNTVEASR